MMGSLILILMGSISVSGQLPTYPSPNRTLTLTCYQLTVVINVIEFLVAVTWKVNLKLMQLQLLLTLEVQQVNPPYRLIKNVQQF